MKVDPKNVHILERLLSKAKSIGKKKTAGMGINTGFTRQMMSNSSGVAGYGHGGMMGAPKMNMPSYDKGGKIKKDGYLTDKKGKPYARVHKGEKVVPKDEKTKKAWALLALR